AEALARRPWAIVEHMAKMTAALTAMHFRAGHEEAAILAGLHCAFQRLIEARPAGAAFELRLGVKQLLAAPRADELAVPLLGIQRAGAGTFGAVLAQHGILCRRQLLTPFLIAM